MQSITYLSLSFGNTNTFPMEPVQAYITTNHKPENNILIKMQKTDYLHI